MNYDVNNVSGDVALVKALCKELHINYTQFPKVYSDKFRWQRYLWPMNDRLGFANRICKDVTNMILSEPVIIWTPSEFVNDLIQQEIYGRLHLMIVYQNI